MFTRLTGLPSCGLSLRLKIFPEDNKCNRPVCCVYFLKMQKVPQEKKQLLARKSKAKTFTCSFLGISPRTFCDTLSGVTVNGLHVVVYWRWNGMTPWESHGVNPAPRMEVSIRGKITTAAHCHQLSIVSSFFIHQASLFRPNLSDAESRKILNLTKQIIASLLSWKQLAGRNRAFGACGVFSGNFNAAN